QSKSQQREPQRSEPQRNESQRSELQQRGPQQSEPQRSKPPRSDPLRSKPQQSGLLRSEPQRGDPQRSEPQRSEPLESGPIWGWKKCKDGVLVKLVVGDTAKRSHATGRKCRAEHVKVLEVIGAEVGISSYDNKTEYRVGQVVRCDKWDENRWAECGGGIHFFLTRIEAERFCL